MKMFNSPVENLIKKRTSWRRFTDNSIPQEKIGELEDFIEKLPAPPFGNPGRFKVVSGDSKDPSTLKKHGTYGFIKNPAIYVIACTEKSHEAIVDLGYLTELIVLKLTDLDIGSCWLGGSFTKGSFNNSMEIGKDEILPFVIAAGDMGDARGTLDKIVRWSAGAAKRIDFDKLFFSELFTNPLNKKKSGLYYTALQMVQAAPSASNRQPWRVVKCGNALHFYINRIKSYNKTLKIMKLADLPASDLGIAMSHFEQTLSEQGKSGKWEHTPPSIEKPEEYEYVASWVEG